ncbi:MAG: Holliday junction resolvase RuvX [Bacteroidetes bacterium]|nr:Holliday junction resolvase RuvX [Bacteroidota bacterium]
MSRILAIDYGLKRTGIAVSDPLKIIAGALTTIESSKLISFLEEYFKKESVELILIGEPKNLDDSDTHATLPVKRIVEELGNKFPAIPIKMIDERFTSKMASRAMIDMGMKKKQRQDKGMVDKIAATIMLQEYMREHM